MPPYPSSTVWWCYTTDMLAMTRWMHLFLTPALVHMTGNSFAVNCHIPSVQVVMQHKQPKQPSEAQVMSVSAD